MLDELCEDYEYERKDAIKLLCGGLPPASGRIHPGPEPQYELTEPVVRQIWLTAEQPCGKRLVPILRQWLPYYERRFGQLSGRPRQSVRQVSAATLDRLLALARAEPSGRGRCGTKPGSLLRSEIPIRTGTWDLSRPGYWEADSVAHCGGSLAGNFSIIICGLTCESAKPRWSLPVPGPTTPTPTRMWSKKTGRGPGNFWAMDAWKTRSWWVRSARGIGRYGPRGRTSFCPV